MLVGRTKSTQTNTAEHLYMEQNDPGSAASYRQTGFMTWHLVVYFIKMNKIIVTAMK